MHHNWRVCVIWGKCELYLLMKETFICFSLAFCISEENEERAFTFQNQDFFSIQTNSNTNENRPKMRNSEEASMMFSTDLLFQ